MIMLWPKLEDTGSPVWHIVGSGLCYGSMLPEVTVKGFQAYCVDSALDGPGDDMYMEWQWRGWKW